MTPDRPAAFFDFDRTVVDGDAGVLFGHELLRLQRRRVRDAGRGTLGWALRNVGHEARIAGLFSWAAVLTAGTRVGAVKRSRVIRQAYRRLKGFRLDELRELAGDFFEDELRHRLLPSARDEIEAHHAAGRPVIVVSTGMHVVIDPVQRHLPVDDVIAVTLLDRNGVVTGQVQGPLWGHEKARAVRAYAHAHGLSLPKSHAYSDHYSDLQFLRLVGHPHVVNPGLRLRLHAGRRGWMVHRWRRPDSRPRRRQR